MERGEDGKYELPEDYRYYLFILQKKNRKRPKKLFFSGSDPENKKINNSLELAVIHFILLLISETILASSRTEHRYLHSLQFTSSVYFTI